MAKENEKMHIYSVCSYGTSCGVTILTLQMKKQA